MRWSSGGIVAGVVLSMGACVPAYDYDVKGPDGHWWHAVHCSQEQTNCWEKAAEICPNGYVVADSSGHNSGFGGVSTPMGGGAAFFGASSYHGEMLVRCKSAEERAEARRDSSSSSSSSVPVEYAQCSTDYDSLADMAGVWVNWFGGEQAGAVRFGDFLPVCRSLSRDARLCLYAPYAADHRDHCVEVIRGLPTETRHALDHLLATRGAQTPDDEPDSPQDPGAKKGD
jgi:hypothetical protein